MHNSNIFNRQILGKPTKICKCVDEPSTVLGNAISVTYKGTGAIMFAALAVLDVDGDERLDSARTEVRAGKGAVVAIIPAMPDLVGAGTLGSIAGADDDALRL